MRRWVRIPICTGTEHPLSGMWKRNPAAKAGLLPGWGLQKAAVTMADTHCCQDKDFQGLSPHPPAYLKRRNILLWNVLESVLSRPQKIWRKNNWQAQWCYLNNKTQPSSGWIRGRGWPNKVCKTCDGRMQAHKLIPLITDTFKVEGWRSRVKFQIYLELAEIQGDLWNRAQNSCFNNWEPYFFF